MELKDELLIRITAEGEIKLENTQNGVRSYKQVAPSTFVDCIRESIRTGMVSSGLLPKGCLSFAQGDSGKRRVCIEYGMDKSDITYEKTLYPDFPLPRLVFGFNLNESRITNVDLGVVPCGILTPKSRMLVYPFSNVLGFSLCLGTNRLPDIKSLHQLSGIMHYIISMPNNNDHYHPQHTRLNLEYRHLLETLKDKTQAFYYTDVLAESGKTLEEFIDYGRKTI